MRISVQITAVALFVHVFLYGAIWQAQAQGEKASYLAMVSVDQYSIPDKDSEIALARSAAPKSISDAAEVMRWDRRAM